MAITFDGVNLQAGDSAKWVRSDATGCDSPFDVTGTSTVYAASGGMTASFVFGDAIRSAVYTGRLLLCYKFRYSQQLLPSWPTPFILFANVNVAVVRYDSLLPRGTAIGCSSHLTVLGAGYSSLLGAAMRSVHCGFAGLGQTSATVVNDTVLHCKSPLPLAHGTYPLRIDVGSGLTTLQETHFPNFGTFDVSKYSIDSLQPAGGPYNMEWDVMIEGTFEDWGAPRCQFGSWIGSAGVVINSTHASCRKPQFPDDVRDDTGEYAVTFSPNGQCFASATSAAFLVYNSQVDSLRISGAASTSSVQLQIDGEGFVYPTTLAGGVCRFTRTSNDGARAAVLASTPLQTISATLVLCPTPASGVAGRWSVEVLQNGVTPEPSLFGNPLFDEFDTTAVRVDGMIPSSLVDGQETAVTIVGSGFADYGEGQVVCRAGGSIVIGNVLNSSCILCTIPATPSSARRELADSTIDVSLSGGAAGSWTVGKQAGVFVAPYLASVSPTTGKAAGGTTVTLTGLGFTALSYVQEVRASAMRCKFGDVELREPPLWHSNTQVVCKTTWGTKGAQPVSLSLNGVDFSMRATPSTTPSVANISALPHFTFVGSHPPSLIDVHFDEQSTRLFMKLDSQPTNRAGMNGALTWSDLARPYTHIHT